MLFSMALAVQCYPPAMTGFRTGVSLPDLALLLGDLYQRANLGLMLGEEHQALPDDLGCHPNVQEAV